MGKIIGFISLAILLLTLSACGGGDSFRITGQIPGIGTQNLNVVYYADGTYHSTRTAVVDGKFMFEGSSRDWTTVYIFTNSRALLGMVIIRNGENVDAKFELNNPSATVLSGTKPSEVLSEWYSSGGDVLKSGDSKAINDAVRDFVIKNRDNLAATVVLTTYYRSDENPSQGDSLLQLLDAKVRQGNLAEGWADRISNVLDSARMNLPKEVSFFDVGDTIHTLEPLQKGYLVLYSPEKGKRNTVSDRLLKENFKSGAFDSLGVSFIEIDRYISDTASWKSDVRENAVPWIRLWHPLNSGRLPFVKGESLLVVDSLGRIIYNGSDIDRGLKKVKL